MGSYTRPTPGMWVTAAIIMAGLSAWTSTTRAMCMAGLQRRSAAAFGDMAALLAMAQTCLSSQGTHSIRAATGWVAKLSSDCKRVRLGPACPLITGRRAIGSILTIATPIWAALAQLSSTYLALHLPSLCSRWAKIAMLICSTATISEVFPVLRTRRMWEELTEAYPLSLPTPAREHILVFTMAPGRSERTRLLPQVRLWSPLAGA